MDKLSTITAGIQPKDLQAGKMEAELQRANSLKNRDIRSEAEVEKAAGGFEALLLHQMLKSMWSTVQTTGFLNEDSNQAQIYRDMLNQAIADSVAEGRGIGVKQYVRKVLLPDTKQSS